MSKSRELARCRTYIPGFDLISNGGLPEGRTTLVSGGPGSAKTILAAQFLAEGILQAGEAGCFVTFEERPADIRRNLSSFGWEIAKWEEENKWIFVDGSLHPKDEPVTIGDYDLGGLMARVDHAVRKTQARRVSLDSIGAMLVQFGMPAVIRRELNRVAWQLRSMGVTSIITAEHTSNAEAPVEEYVTDNVIILRNTLDDEKRRRTLEILKFRGASHLRGEYPFTISENGIILLPLSSIELRQKSSDKRITSGIAELDAMCGGGFYRDSVILVSGATGTGKTLTATEFLAALGEEERGLLFAFEESRDQLYRNALGWGVDFPKLEAGGRLGIVCEYPEVAAPEDHLLRIKKHIEEFKPTRVAVDSLSALERISTPRTFREFVLALTSYLKDKQIAGVFTSTTPSLLGGSTVTEAHISSVTDSIILLRYVEAFGEMRRGIAVLKMRGSVHDRNIREYLIDSTGMHVGEPFRGISGILSGYFTHAVSSEVQTLAQMFDRADEEG